MDVIELLHLFLLESLKLNSHLVLNLNSFSVSDVVIMKDIHILNSFSLKISVKFLTPFI